MSRFTTCWRIIRLGLWTAGMLSLYTLLVHLWLRPWHEAGICQPLLGYLNGFEHVLQLVGRFLNRLLGVPTITPYFSLAWCFRTGVNITSWFLLGCFVGMMVYWGWQPALIPGGNAEPEKVSSRRRFLRQGVVMAKCGVAATLGYSLVVEPRWFGVTHRTIRLRDLPPELDGLRLVQITDIHHGPWLDIEYVQSVVQTANALRPDLICLTGDYIHHSGTYIQPVLAELADLRANIGIVAVLGNHDWWENITLFYREFRRAGIPLIDNDRRIITPERHLVGSGDRGLVIAGVGDLWEHVQDYERALGNLPESLPRVLLSHNPDVAEEGEFLRCNLRVDLMLSGHTHGGQIYVPGLGTPIVPSRYGQKYAQGLVDGPKCPVYISRGLGTSILPLRCGVAPEIAVLELRVG